MKMQVKGSQQLEQIARVLETKGNGPALKRRMTKSFRESAKPITDAQRRSLAAGLPKRGGAASTISSEARFSVRTSTVKATVTIVDSWKGHDFPSIDRGRLRHPLFGNRNHWFNTGIKPHLLTIPFLTHKRTVQAALLKEMDALAQEIARET